ncbi:hypothetical protein acsn021_05210 [Anaerocolumna cellulosilytica]|uniref:Uncharacterized protein n=1 Tax=Anaerocolumna cellulosilytica TaxID=433286 RepID=A0A6S6R069_9FIRM|nr:glycosyltransferase [Anaerocolumna cellulosilytica]MBB5195712.1 mannosyltransferase OCH1-like enzyme [Anaerocolumna cellulosilytica]BCJ92952.1 hypothetical protein acsn021_05210 [Anaerocolumna cellulosilytica]
MHLNYGGYNEFYQAQKDKKIVCFGAGMMPYYIEDLLEQWGVINNISFFIDNSKKKLGYVWERRKVPILTIDAFLDKGLQNYIILITCETFEPICGQLEQLEQFNDIDCFIYAYVNKSYIYTKFVQEPVPDQLEVKIPRTIHYCWFGGQKLSDLEERCIQSWKEFCPDYEIVRWDENNYDVNKNLYMKQAYKAGKWAFVSDYARLDILYTYGGIYLDTDVEIIKSIERLLYNEAFIAYGEWPSLNSGAGIGSVKGNEILKEMRDDPRSTIPFINNHGEYNLETNSIYESAVLKKYGLKQNFEIQLVKNFMVYHPVYFAPASVVGDRAFINEYTYAIHHCHGSWADKKRKIDKKKTLNRLRRDKE